MFGCFVLLQQESFTIVIKFTFVLGDAAGAERGLFVGFMRVGASIRPG